MQILTNDPKNCKTLLTMELDGSELLQIIPSGKRKSVVNFIAVYTIYIYKNVNLKVALKVEG